MVRLTLAVLVDAYVFESSPSRHDLGALHVPFDDLIGVSATESLLDKAVRRGENVALIGGTGSGKSSDDGAACAHRGGCASPVLRVGAETTVVGEPRHSRGDSTS